jgi:hypothetical protein
MARYNLHIRILDPALQQPGSNLSLNLEKPILVTGFQALINRWMMTFMTPKGSHPTKPNEGTKFPFLIGSNVAEIAALEAVVAECVDDASTQVRAVDDVSPLLTSAERLQTAQLLRFNAIDATSIEFWVEIINEANQRLTVLIPYAVN